MKYLTRIDCADWLLDGDRFTILTHRKPDGDTVGSAAALCLGLRQLGKTAHVLENPELTPLFAPLLEGSPSPSPRRVTCWWRWMWRQIICCPRPLSL